jgi:hypothetical protein
VGFDRREFSAEGAEGRLGAVEFVPYGRRLKAVGEDADEVALPLSGR